MWKIIAYLKQKNKIQNRNGGSNQQKICTWENPKTKNQKNAKSDNISYHITPVNWQKIKNQIPNDGKIWRNIICVIGGTSFYCNTFSAEQSVNI